MTDDEVKAYLKPKTNWGSIIAIAIALGSSTWAVTGYLHSRADDGDVREMRKDAYQTRLDMETMKGDMKAINIRVDEGFKNIGNQLGYMNGRRGNAK